MIKSMSVCNMSRCRKPNSGPPTVINFSDFLSKRCYFKLSSSLWKTCSLIGGISLRYACRFSVCHWATAYSSKPWATAIPSWKHQFPLEHWRQLGHGYWLALGWVIIKGLDMDVVAASTVNPRCGETGLLLGKKNEKNEPLHDYPVFIGPKLRSTAL